MARQTNLAPGYGERLRSLRRDTRFQTLQEFARDIGMHYQQLSRWENEDQPPSLRTLHKIAEATGVSLEYLAYGKE